MKNLAERPIVKASKFRATELDRVAREEAAAMVAEGNKRAADGKAASEASRTQAEKFEDAARELGCEEDEDRFNGVLRKLAKPKN